MPVAGPPAFRARREVGVSDPHPSPRFRGALKHSQAWAEKVDSARPASSTPPIHGSLYPARSRRRPFLAGRRCPPPRPRRSRTGRRPRATANATDPLERASPGLIAFLGARLKFDELYAATFGRLNTFGAAFSDFMDRSVWGGLVNFTGRFGLFSGWFSRDTDEGGLNAGFDATSEKLRGTGQAYSRAQTGDAHGYLRFLAVGFVVLALVAIFGGVP